jgi:hypothetical protein
VRLANVNGKKLESFVVIAPTEFIQGRDLAHKRWSRDAAKLEQHMLFAPKCGEANLVTLQAG